MSVTCACWLDGGCLYTEHFRHCLTTNSHSCSSCTVASCRLSDSSIGQLPPPPSAVGSPVSHATMRAGQRVWQQLMQLNCCKQPNIHRRQLIPPLSCVICHMQQWLQEAGQKGVFTAETASVVKYTTCNFSGHVTSAGTQHL